MRITRLLFLLLLGLAVAHAEQDPAVTPRSSREQPAAPASTGDEPLKRRVEAFLRHLYAWTPSVQVRIGNLKDAPVAGLYEVAVNVILGEQSDTATLYISKDGRFLLRGEMQDMAADPFAAVRRQMRLDNSPSSGPADAKVVVVEYADFQCPSCRKLHQILRAIAPKYPQVRLVFKDLPLAQLHPWAMTAALAGRCAFQQNPDSFWKLQDTIFEHQDLISPENVWQKMLDFAAQAGLNTNDFRACLSSQDAHQAVLSSLHEAEALKINATPALFVNGRRLPAIDQALLEQFIQFDLSAHPSTARKQ